MTASTFIAETTSNQRIAANPSISAFVSANAGSGKTRVLTNRVARLLLEGADPAAILCITFTKAAAAEMADRLFKLLGDWALAKDSALQTALQQLDGEARVRSPAELARARRLFARALETPGGLKIQTIHAFCESLLKRFPLEAGVAPGFSIIDEIEAKRAISLSIDRVALSASPEIDDALSYLLTRISGERLHGLIEQALKRPRLFSLAGRNNWDAMRSEVRKSLGIASGPAPTIDDIISVIEKFDLGRLKTLMEIGTATTINRASKIDEYQAAYGGAAKFEAIKSVFLTEKNEPRKDVVAKKFRTSDPEFCEKLDGLQIEIMALQERVRAAEAAADTAAFLTLVEAGFIEYSKIKDAAATLDFDDLITASARLLRRNSGAEWVLYKLDAGLNHILLDEAQDTSPDAWSVIEAPLAEFFAGVGARNGDRTFFAVGDQKQSIYSFQGADSALFGEKRGDLGKKISSAARFENVMLKASFRTTSPVLEFVDALFRHDDVIDNVGEDRPLTHYCTRHGVGGIVELWPLVRKEKSEKPSPWDAPLDARPADNPARRLANEIAATISGWLTNNQVLESAGRPIRPDDIMILVQARNAMFHEIIRALGARGVPAGGPDRIVMMNDQGVLDLISFARTALYPGDDLSLAETLKSPFFGLDEDALYDLAANRANARLWDELRQRSNERAEWQAALQAIEVAQKVAADEGPVTFFSHVLECGDRTGWKRMFERLGTTAREPIDELLRLAHEFERRHPRSLRLFLNDFVSSGAEISREASQESDVVRVMTVHKAKGLEANIVFLPDASRPAQAKLVGDIVTVSSADGDRLPVLALGEANSVSRIEAARDETKRLVYDEYRRLLYVAATRARDRLYICGIEGVGDPHGPPRARKSWHALAQDAFEELSADATDADERFGGVVRRLTAKQTAPIDQNFEIQSDDISRTVPVPLLQKAPVETKPIRIAPSHAGLSNNSEQSFSPMRLKIAFVRGKLIHKLLELLPGILPTARRDAADRILKSHAREFSDSDRAAIREEVMKILEDERFGAVFAPNSRSEVFIAGRPKSLGGREIAGQIDRLAVSDERVLIVDYKANRPPPQRIEDAPESYVAQLALYRILLEEIYPGREVEAALLWTFDARLMPAPKPLLDRHAERFMTVA